MDLADEFGGNKPKDKEAKKGKKKKGNKQKKTTDKNQSTHLEM